VRAVELLHRDLRGRPASWPASSTTSRCPSLGRAGHRRHPAMTQITADMVSWSRSRRSTLSTDAAQSTNQVVGQYAAMPILAGQ